MKDVSRIPPKWRRDLAGEFKSIDQILAEDLKEHVENGTNPFEPPPPPMFDLKPDEKIHDVTGSMVVDNSPKPSRLSNLIEGKKRVNFRDNRSVDVNGDYLGGRSGKFIGAAIFTWFFLPSILLGLWVLYAGVTSGSGWVSLFGLLLIVGPFYWLSVHRRRVSSQGDMNYDTEANFYHWWDISRFFW